jgi:hypothetical protein
MVISSESLLVLCILWIAPQPTMSTRPVTTGPNANVPPQLHQLHHRYFRQQTKNTPYLQLPHSWLVTHSSPPILHRRRAHPQFYLTLVCQRSRQRPPLRSKKKTSQMLMATRRNHVHACSPAPPSPPTSSHSDP